MTRRATTTATPEGTDSLLRLRTTEGTAADEAESRESFTTKRKVA